MGKTRERPSGSNPLVSFRAPPEIVRFLEERSGGRPLGTVVKECLERYAGILARGMDEIRSLGLSEEEAERALSGLSVRLDAAHLVVEDLAERLGREDPLVQKLASLSSIGRIALAEAGERFRLGNRLVVKEIAGATSRGKRNAGRQKARLSPAA